MFKQNQQRNNRIQLEFRYTYPSSEQISFSEGDKKKVQTLLKQSSKFMTTRYNRLKSWSPLKIKYSQETLEHYAAKMHAINKHHRSIKNITLLCST